MSAQIKPRPHADNPLLCGYEISADSPAQVQFAISNLMEGPDVAWAEFSNPHRNGQQFISIGTVLSYEKQSLQAAE
jgi:hypothetical protein